MRRAVIGRMPQWARENQEMETAMLVSESANTEYRADEKHKEDNMISDESI